MVPIK